MDRIIDIQFRELVAAMAEQGVEIDVVRNDAGDPDHMFRAGVVLTTADENGLDRITSYLGDGRVDRVSGSDRLAADGVTELRLSGISVTDAVRVVARNEAGRLAGPTPDGPPAARIAPDHVVHICRICPATEPHPADGHPVPPVRPGHDGHPSHAGHGVHLAVCDTGLLEPLDTDLWPWLAGVTGVQKPDLLPPVGADGVQHIPKYAGHGTFVAGVARTMAPRAGVVVGNHMQTGEAALESVFCDAMAEMVRIGPVPDILVLSAGTLTLDDLPPVAFENFRRDVLRKHPDMVLISAAGNNADDRPFWPAAFDWTTGVGALDETERARADYSCYGPWVKVYVRGSKMVNAFPNGRYFYNEDETTGLTANFTSGLATWDGTSFSTPLFAGLVAARMSRTGERAPAAVAALLALAADADHHIAGLGPALRWEEDL